MVPVSRRVSASASAAERRRPRNFARSVSCSVAAAACSSADTRCTANTGCWLAARGRRRHTSACACGSHSVSRNSFPNAGCARSARGSFSTTSARLVTSSVRGAVPWLTSVTRRTSASWSGATAISVRVSIAPSRRRNSALSAEKTTS